MKKNYNFSNMKRDSWIHIRKILSDTTLITLERTMYLAMILLLVQYRFQNHWSDDKQCQSTDSKVKLIESKSI